MAGVGEGATVGTVVVNTSDYAGASGPSRVTGVDETYPATNGSGDDQSPDGAPGPSHTPGSGDGQSGGDSEKG